MTTHRSRAAYQRRSGVSMGGDAEESVGAGGLRLRLASPRGGRRHRRRRGAAPVPVRLLSDSPNSASPSEAWFARFFMHCQRGGHRPRGGLLAATRRGRSRTNG